MRRRLSRQQITTDTMVFALVQTFGDEGDKAYRTRTIRGRVHIYRRGVCVFVVL